jgi:hypothetical protein
MSRDTCITCGSEVIFQPTALDAFSVECGCCDLRYIASGTVAAMDTSSINRLTLARWIREQNGKGDAPMVTSFLLRRFMLNNDSEAADTYTCGRFDRRGGNDGNSGM